MSCDGVTTCCDDFRLVSKGLGAGWLVGQGVRSLPLAGSCEKPNAVVNLGNLNVGEVDC